MHGIVLETSIPELRLLARGKVRDIYDLGERLLLVATDRISAFDCILPTGIPDKGRVLTSMSRFWFDRFRDRAPNHLDGPAAVPDALKPQWDALSDRSMLAQKARPFPIECVARGFLSGSAWKEYRANVHAGRTEHGLVPCAGVLLPSGLVESSKLPEPVFTPSTKAASGHDEPISFEQAAAIVGRQTAERLRSLTLDIYTRALDYAASRGIIIADTKFEFGDRDGEILWIDEALTPDSSRFWDMDTYRPGGPQPSYDKQFVRDYLESLDWDKTPPAPPLPSEIADRTAEKYRDAHHKITGRALGDSR